MSRKLIIRLAFLGGIIFWLFYTSTNIYWLLVDSYDVKEELSRILPQVFFSFFVVCLFVYYRYVVTKADTLNFTDLLWKVFITGLVTTLISLGIQLFFTVFSESSIVDNPLIINFFYSLLIGLVMVYMISTLVVWKRLILYQRSKNLLQLWSFFEIALVIALGFDFIGYKIPDTNFRIALLIIGLFGFVLAFNLKWIAYLNFRQKWKSILFILLSGIYLYHFTINLSRFSVTGVLTFDLFDRVFFLGVLGFLFLYALIAILVTLFNLPTSSVFEQKLKEAIDFQKLSESIPRGQTKDQTFEVLLESSMSAVFADAAWLEIKDENGINQTIRNLTADEIEEVKSKIKEGPIWEIINYHFSNDRAHYKLNEFIKHSKFKSLIAVPINVQNKQIGFLILLNEISDAFNREMVSIITTFVNQASISLENLELIKESIENERYKEQLVIAKNVQKSLLPNKLINNEHLLMEAYSMAADEVGGDYYDFIEINPNLFGLIIGDVSGKGTSAAFHMAQMKGIFHSLAIQGDGPQTFVKRANLALSHCLEKSSFITATYFEIDTKNKTLEFSRAGHCPSLIYCQKNNQAEYLDSEGMGLGIVRNSRYDEYVSSSTINYHAGDTLLLYTDGITEARNQDNEQFGNDRLKKSFSSHASLSPTIIKENMKKDLSQFIGGIPIDDDYTMVIVRFK
jgi:serine phosphatase RsbU (regulator of sigma subunit)